MSELLRFGLIGSGSQGRYLSEALAMTQRAELVACADVNLEKAQEASAACGYSTPYGDRDEMLANENLDAVIVATTHDQLFPCAMAAVAAGKHALVEKPMALNPADGVELCDAANAAGVKLMVGYSLRFMPERIEMKRRLDQGAIGSAQHINGGQLIGNMGGWLDQRALGGGPLFYIGSHILDQILWLAGSAPERVYAEVDWKEGSDVEAGLQMTMRFPGGVTGAMCTSQKLGGRYGWVDLMGTGGRMRAEWESHDLLIQSTTIPEYTHLTRVHMPGDAGFPAASPEATARVNGFKYVRIWMNEMWEFIDAIEQDRDPSVNGADGVRALQAINAAFRSAETGAPVDIDPYQ